MEKGGSEKEFGPRSSPQIDDPNQVCVHANGKTSGNLKSVFKMSTVCSNASSKTWTPLPGCFIDDHLVEMFPLFD